MKHLVSIWLMWKCKNSWFCASIKYSMTFNAFLGTRNMWFAIFCCWKNNNVGEKLCVANSYCIVNRYCFVCIIQKSVQVFFRNYAWSCTTRQSTIICLEKSILLLDIHCHCFSTNHFCCILSTRSHNSNTSTKLSPMSSYTYQCD